MKQSSAFRNTAMVAGVAPTLFGGITLVGIAPGTAYAQAATLPNITLDLKDTPIRTALEQVFRTAKLDFSIDPSVQGYVNLKVTDIPFESALRLILRASATPLTYTKEENVYLVKPRTVSINAPSPAESMLALAAEVPPRSQYDRIELTYADPVDLAQILNITMIPIGTRHGLRVPGATGIIRPGGPAGTSTTPPTGGNNGIGIIGSGGPGTGPGVSGLGIGL